MRFRQRFALWGALAAFAVVPGVSQTTTNSSPPSDFFLVRNFFYEASELHEMGEDWLEFNMLRQLEIKPGTPEAEALVKWSLKGRSATTGVLPIKPGEDGEAYENRQRHHMRTKIHQAAEIYSEMLTELAVLGVDLDVLDHFIRQELGQGVSVIADPTEETREFLEFVDLEFALAAAAAAEATADEPAP